MKNLILNAITILPITSTSLLPITIKGAKSEIIIYKGTAYDYKVETKIDKSSSWVGETFNEVTLKLNDYGITVDKLIKNFDNVTFDYYFEHLDNAPLGSGSLIKVESSSSRDVKDILQHAKYTYSSSFTSSSAKEKFNSIKDGDLNNPDLGILKKHTKNYTQNKSYGFLAFDIKYDVISNAIKMRPTAIAGKFRSGWNQAKVHSKVAFKIKNIKLT